MQLIMPSINIVGDTETRIMARAGTLHGVSKNRTVWCFGFTEHSDMAEAFHVSTVGFTWVIATYRGRVIDRLDGKYWYELPDRYKAIINAAMDTDLDGEEDIYDKYTLYTYDLIGNDDDGYEVNDRYRAETITLPEAMTEHDIRKALDITCDIDADGDDMTIYVSRLSDGKPLCELIREED